MSIDFQSPVSVEDVEEAFKIVLKRLPDNPNWTADRVAAGASLQQVLTTLITSAEFRARTISEAGAVLPDPGRLDDHSYRLPDALEISGLDPRKAILIGSCLMDDWPKHIQNAAPGFSLKRIVFNNASRLPEMEKDEAASYDFQVLQVPIRSILPEAAYFNLKFSDLAGHEKLFEDSCQMMQYNLDALLKYNERFGMLSFVLNFWTPQQNPMGRMVDRYSLTNMVYFVEMLNRRLHEYVAQRKNCYIVDVDQITNTFGKKFFQDDSIVHANHGSLLGDIRRDGDHDRLEPAGDVEKIYVADKKKYILTIWHEVISQFKTLQQAGSIKLVIFDLDDTLWRGVAAERGYAESEGWPLGMQEAAAYLWKRGVLIAIVSKNDESAVREIWRKDMLLDLDHFVSVKINWHNKADNIAQILREVNLLPGSVLFVDDNPVERAAVKAAFPDIRVLDKPLAHWRRVLLWSTELQRAVLTDEAVARTEMIQAQLQREERRSNMSHEAFLAALGTHITVCKVSETGGRGFARCFELLNKTNQFNTTGKRWTQAELENLFAAGGYFLSLEVVDKFTAYGITGLLIMHEYVIEQFVLSCRVFGMQIEHAAIAIAQRFAGPRLFGKIVPTEKNGLSTDLYQNLGFTEIADGLWRGDGALAVPAQIELTVEEAVLPAL